MTRNTSVRSNVAAGRAAGASVLGWRGRAGGHDAPAALRSAGALHIFNDMGQLPHLLG